MIQQLSHTRKLLVLIVEGHHPRRRLKFIENPLQCFHEIDLRVIQFSSRLILSLIRSLYLSFKYRTVDIVLSCDIGACGLAWLIYSKLIMRNIFVLRLGGNPERSIVDASIHGCKSKLPISSKIKLIMNKFVLKNIRHLIVVSPNLKNEIMPYLRPDCKIYIVPQYVNVNEIVSNTTIRRETVTLLTTTNLQFRSKFEPLQLAIQQLVNNSGLIKTPLIWNICGGGRFLSELRQFVDSLKLPNYIKIFIEGYRDDLVNFYQDADVFVYASYLDGLPNVILEAMSFDLPVIINRELACCFDSEAIQYFRIFDLNENGSIVQGLNFVLNTKDNRTNFGDHYRKFIEDNFSVASVGQQLANVLCSVIGDSTHGHYM